MDTNHLDTTHAPALPPRDTLEQAFFASDATYDGLFWTGVRTTGIFCRPSCRARKPRPENIEFFATIGQALFAGYRPCLRCRPAEAPGAVPEWAADLVREIDGDPAPRVAAADLRARGLDPARVRRFWLKRFGVTFAGYCRARRLGGALRQLRGGASVDDTVWDSGYASHSGFRDAFAREVGKPPGRARATRLVTTALIDSPIGPLYAGALDEGIVLLEFSDRRMLEAQLRLVERRFDAALLPGQHALLERLGTELAEYFAGRRRTFDVPVLTPGTPFQERVWDELRRVPYGTTMSYAQLAARLGRPAAARAVGTANGMNRVAILVPCHRVITAAGTIGGYGGGRWRKDHLLALEARNE